MDLDRYNDAASTEVHWYLDQLLKEGVDGVWRSGIMLGAVGINNILTQRGNEISEFMSLPPSQRTKRLAKITDSIDRHGFLIAATYNIRCGVAWLDIACRYGVSAGYNPQPRFLLGQASTAARELFDAFPTLWPFDDYPDPFGPGEP
ncbi:hypothetical protein FJQ54_07295 [Sandaracinobacter neustonicus]|uniref:Uncharacterized protein n=1 Tax=Sandaracinobacter neustonicus TaxID=1715348 RepID=A0A501XP73_9SPHN|nr:hypothetical protein [Sandaracinobacter neustonicus]TPE61927.1 hypothetical protein FJQ54_07295 [Sandaracinobacter neustonicus]